MLPHSIRSRTPDPASLAVNLYSRSSLPGNYHGLRDGANLSARCNEQVVGLTLKAAFFRWRS